MSSKSTKGPVLIELDEDRIAESPAEAPAVPEIVEAQPRGQAMQTIATLGARPPSRLARWFWSLLLLLLGFVASLAFWDFVTALLARNPWLGGAAVGLAGLLGLVALAMILREWAALARLRRLDGIHKDAAAALVSGDLGAARKVTTRLQSLYRGRDDLAWGNSRFEERAGEQFDADALLGLAEDELIAPIDSAAEKEIEAAARQVATVTAIVPLALADVVAALTVNLRMIRRIAELYGGRAGTFGSWRLTRTVLTHLVATGAVAVGDDLIGSLAGGGLLSKVSRRFGEGIINGALTARVGVAAMEVCRPLPFHKGKPPSVTGLIKRALTGLFTG